MKTLVFGEILWDIIDGKSHLGGAPLNFAAHINQCGNPSTIISCLGTDEFGEKAFHMIDKQGVNTSMIQRSKVRTGYVPVTIVDGQPEYEITKDVAYDYIDAEKLDHHLIANNKLFYFGSLIQRSRTSEKALYEILDRHLFEDIFYDVNLRKECYTQTIIEKSLQYCTILKMNVEEVEEISTMLFGEIHSVEEFGRHIKERFKNIHTLIVTAGEAGCYIFHENNLSSIPTERIVVADTVGAGDAFSAAYLSVYSRTADPLKAGKTANEVGGFVASSQGPIPRYPSNLKQKISRVS